MPRLDALIRVSQLGDRSLDDLRSPDQQREIIDREAARIGATVAQEHVSIGLSGKTMDRPDIAAVLDRIRRGETDGLIVAFASRLSRARVDEALLFKRAIDDAGGRLVIGDMAGLDIDTASGELTFTMMLAVARYQWKQIQERFDQSRRNAVAAGKSMGGAPFGYRYADPTPRANGSGVRNSRLVPDERLAPVVRQLYERKADGATWLQLARWLGEVAPRADGKSWARSSVISIIRRRTYLGEVAHGEHRLPNAHESIVPAALWRKAQNEPGVRTPRGTYLISGLVKCASCGRNMRGGRAHSQRRRDYQVYKCVNPDCPHRVTAAAERLELEVVRQLEEHLADAGTMATLGPDPGEALTEVQRLTEQVQTLAAVVPTHPAAITAHQEALEEAEAALYEAEERLRQIGPAGPGLAFLGSERGLPPTDKPYLDLNLSLEEGQEMIRAGVAAVVIRPRVGNGPASDTAARITVQFHADAARRYGATFARLIRPSLPEGWIASA